MVTGVIQITGPLFLVFMFILERYIQTLKKILILFMISGITHLEISRKEPLFINAIYISKRNLIQPRCLQERSSREQRKSIFREESIMTIILSYFLFLTRAEKQKKFEVTVERCFDYINNSRYLKLEPVTEDVYKYLEFGYFNSFYEDRYTEIDVDKMKVGNKFIGLFAVNQFKQLGESVK